MKRLILLASLCVGIAALVPVASASAAEDACTIEGNAELTPHLGAELKSTKFSFVATPGTSCSVSKSTITEATVTGEGELSCPAGENIVGLNGKVSGEGTIRRSIDPAAKHFKFELVATAGVVSFKASGEVTGGGAAEFLTHKEAAEKCAKLNAGGLEFTALVAGTF
ncbi:MAG TPA: hypothetical protein VGX51_02970 [Solirubrobacteraceae bacterium]|jgi:hypothetical protein|nr:hypothetical protein [Solirubrobacteraceae bacterium]